jgi:hypothetical protein
MMNNQLKNFIQKLTQVQLSATDRSAVRERLALHITENQPVVSNWISVFRKPALVIALLIFVVTGVSIAAETAVPGDSLYAVKVNVNETIMSLTSLDSISEAENESRIAARRIAELETLAARGSLDSQISDSLTLAISKHTQSAREHIKDVSEQGETSSALSLEIELISTLNTHSDILEQIAKISDVQATTTVTAAKELREMAQSKAENDITMAVKGSQSITVRSGNEKVLSSPQAEKLLKRTAGRLKSARSAFDKNYDMLSKSVVSDTLEQMLVASASDVDAAITHIESGDYKAAETRLREALTFAHEVSIIIEAYKLYDLPSGNVSNESQATSTTATSTAKTSKENTSSEVASTTATSSDTDTDVEVSASSTDTATTTESASSATGSTMASTSSIQATGMSTTSNENSQSIRKIWSQDSDGYQKIDKVLKRVDEKLSLSVQDAKNASATGE